MTLIPKKSGSTSLSDFRPIAYVEVIYKAISKFLATQLAAVLPSLISPNQTTFLKGRRISDNVGFYQEFMVEYNSKDGSRKVCSSLDFSKAFDMVRWDAIMVAMEAMGIDQFFRKLVLACIKSASFAALVEGSLTPIFRATRNISKGDPLSPLLFIIVLENENP